MKRKEAYTYLKSPMGEVKKFPYPSAEAIRHKTYGWVPATRDEYLTWIRARGRLIFDYFGFPRD